MVREKSNSLPIKEIKITLMLLAIFVSFWAISSNQYVANFVIQSLVEMDVIPKSAQKDIQIQSQEPTQMQSQSQMHTQTPENQYEQSPMQNQDSNQSQSSEKPGLLD